jgi:Fur family ferric uptake transcriptional regulator
MTRAQRAVLAVLTDHEAFVSAQDLHARIRTTGETVGLTSVYRALQSLAEDGRVDVRRTDAGEATYRACGSDRHHHHLVCTGCGATVEVEAPALERWVRQVADRHGYRVDGHTLEISGRCARCAGR